MDETEIRKITKDEIRKQREQDKFYYSKIFGGVDSEGDSIKDLIDQNRIQLEQITMFWIPQIAENERNIQQIRLIFMAILILLVAVLIGIGANWISNREILNMLLLWGRQSMMT